jgi:hypothetical protein
LAISFWKHNLAVAATLGVKSLPAIALLNFRKCG